MNLALVLGIGLGLGAIARMTTLIFAERRKIKEFEAKLSETRMTPERP